MIVNVLMISSWLALHVRECCVIAGKRKAYVIRKNNLKKRRRPDDEVWRFMGF